MGWLWLSGNWRESYKPGGFYFPFSDRRPFDKPRPCGMNTPHTHPRATELFYVASSGQMQVGFIEENGARLVLNTLNQGQGTIFPKGSIHFQVNLGCEPLTFVAALNSEDPGTSQMAHRCE